MGKMDKLGRVSYLKLLGGANSKKFYEKKLGIKNCDHVKILGICVRYTNAYAKSVYDLYNEELAHEEPKQWMCHSG